jgi:molybdopterin-guanine dinucleotide biosynthesis protein
MDSGKTTACAAIIHGLVRSGLRVGAAKLTGTASTRDLGTFRDAGATTTLDFLDCGWPSTAGCTVTDLTDIAWNLRDHLRAADVDVAVLEIADGVLQSETVALLRALRGQLADARMVLTASESLAGVAGVERLKAMEYDVAAVSGVVTNSVLARREIEEATGVRCIVTNDLVERAPALAGLPWCPRNGKQS